MAVEDTHVLVMLQVAGLLGIRRLLEVGLYTLIFDAGTETKPYAEALQQEFQKNGTTCHVVENAREMRVEDNEVYISAYGNCLYIRF